MIDYTLVLIKKFPGKEWVMRGDNYSDLEWLSDTPKPTKKQLDDLWQKLAADEEAEAAAKAEAKAALLDRLGITEEEAKLLLA